MRRTWISSPWTIYVYTIMSLDCIFDPAKDNGNLAKHGLSLGEAQSFEWETAMVLEDTRKQYPEPRFRATGYIGIRLHVLVFCLRDEVVRVISLRKVNAREVKDYAET